MYGADAKVYRVLCALVDHQVCLCTGVIKTRFVHAEFHRPWVIRSHHLVRLEKEKITDTDHKMHGMMMQFGKTDLGREVTGNIVIRPLNLNFVLFKNCYLNKIFSDNLRSLYLLEVLVHQNPRIPIFYALPLALQEDIFSSAMGAPLKVFLFTLIIFCNLWKKITFLHTNKCLAKILKLFICFLLIFVNQHFLLWRFKHHQITPFQQE